MRHFERALIIAILGCLIVQAPIALADNPRDILIVVNKSIAPAGMSKDEIRDIFLKKRLNWKGGAKAIPIHAGRGSALRDDFRQRLLGMTGIEEDDYWKARQIKTGDPLPAEFGNTLKAVFKIKGAVSYVYREEYKEGIANVLLVLPAN